MALFDYALLDWSASLFNLSASFWAQSRLQFGLLLCVTGWHSRFTVSGNTVSVPDFIACGCPQYSALHTF